MDNSYIINGDFTSALIKLRREDYLLLLSTLFCNLSFDDYADKYYIKSYARSISNPCGNFINHYYINFPSFILIVPFQVTLNFPIFKGYFLMTNELPAFNIELGNTTWLINRQSNREIDFNIQSFKFFSTTYEYINQITVKKTIIFGKISKNEDIPLEIFNAEPFFDHPNQDHPDSKNFTHRHRANTLSNSQSLFPGGVLTQSLTQQQMISSLLTQSKSDKNMNKQFTLNVEIKQTREKIVELTFRNNVILYLFYVKDMVSNFFSFNEDLELCKPENRNHFISIFNP